MKYLLVVSTSLRHSALSFLLCLSVSLCFSVSVCLCRSLCPLSTGQFFKHLACSLYNYVDTIFSELLEYQIIIQVDLPEIQRTQNTLKIFEDKINEKWQNM